MKFAANNSIEAGIWNDARGGFIMIVNSRGQGVRDAKSIMSFFEKPPKSCPHHNNRIATQTPSPKLMSFGNSRSAVRFSYLGKNGAGGETRTPNRPITNRVLYQLSHASYHRLFNRDFCVVNSCNVKKMSFGKICPCHDRSFHRGHSMTDIGLMHKDITGNTGKMMRQKAFRPISDIKINHEFG